MIEKIKQIIGSKNLKELLNIFYVKRMNGLKKSNFSNPLLIIGESGIGKTQIVESFAKENNMFFVKFDLSNVDSTTFNGLMITIKRDGQEPIHHHTIPHFISQINRMTMQGKKCLIFLDEINRTNYEVRNAVFKLVINNEWGINSKKLNEKVFIVGAMNPNTEDYGDTEELDLAFEKRFVKIEYLPELEDWLIYAKSKNLHSIVLNILRDNQHLFNTKEGLDPRSWEDLSYAIYAAEKSPLLSDIIEMYKPSLFPKIKFYLENRKDFFSLDDINIKIKNNPLEFKKIKEMVNKKFNNLTSPRKIEVMKEVIKRYSLKEISDKTYALFLEIVDNETIMINFSELFDNKNNKNKKIIEETDKVVKKYNLNTFKDMHNYINTNDKDD